MPDTPAFLIKPYTSAFALDRSKLSRIVGIVEQRFAEMEMPFRPAYVVRFRDATLMQLYELEDVLALDNTVRNPIVGLEITAGSNLRREDELFELKFQTREYPDVDLTVAGRDARWTNQLFAEVAEQVERTFLRGAVYGLRNWYVSGPLVIAIFLTGLLALLASALVEGSSLPPPVPARDAAQLLTQAQAIETVDQQIEFLFTVKREELAHIAAADTRTTFSELLTVPVLFVTIPLLVVVGALTYMLLRLYPPAVFDWGDMSEHCRKIINQRRTVTTVIVIALFISVLGGMFVTGLADLLR